MKFTIDELLAATGGVLVRGGRDAPPGAVSTDTRTLAPGQTFLAMRGDRFDGHDFLAHASARGAAALIVDRADKMLCADDGASGPAVILVKNTAAALADIARAVRAVLDCPVIAVTGSCGKTTVKEMVGQILERRLRGRRPKASFNNQVGVPLTLLAAEADDQFVLCEFGTSAPGEIAHLASIARPTIGIVTLVAPVHLEGLGSIEGVAEEKAALVDSLPPDGLAVLNADDPRVSAMARRCRGRVVTVGIAGPADLHAEDLRATERGLRFVAEGVLFEVPVLGRHQALLALAAAAAARQVGIPLAETAAALRSFVPPPMRLALRYVGDVAVVNDAYNANPQSMAAALEVIAEHWPGRRKVFFCGQMCELGSESRARHQDLGRMIAQAGIDRLVCVGTEAEAAAEAAVGAGLPRAAVMTAADSSAAAALVPEVLRPGDVVLVKGSRAVRMERVVEAIGGSSAASPGSARLCGQGSAG